MKQLVRHTLALILASFFLVSFTGFRLLVHHCLGCDAVEVVLAADSSHCCQSHHDSQSCCSAGAHDGGRDSGDLARGESCDLMHGEGCDHTHGDGCCKMETLYLKGDFEGTTERTSVKIEAPEIAALDMLVNPADDDRPETRIPGASVTEDPPPRLTGRDFILYSHQLKIC